MNRMSLTVASADSDRSSTLVVPIQVLFREWILAQRAADQRLRAGDEAEWEAECEQIDAIEHAIAVMPSFEPAALAIKLYLACHTDYGQLYGADPAALDQHAGDDRLVVGAIRAAAHWVPEIATLAAPVIGEATT